jgi:cytochrome c biogenesis protein ResB
MGRQEDLMLDAAVNHLKAGRIGTAQPPMPQPQPQMQPPLLYDARAVWVEMVKAGILTPEQGYNILVDNKRPEKFLGTTDEELQIYKRAEFEQFRSSCVENHLAEEKEVAREEAHVQ